ncbi:hypothetical protein SAMN05421756_11615 [Microlunatus flavus]|uniref:Uncharacterized protein n=2 Tax=Microlunatus flavus TaxID=1036181 RepID=A0A1H9NKW6_9ACTN|nr:hypothetical protein SAMN05421756_11615 [Microlunatus flavus]
METDFDDDPSSNLHGWPLAKYRYTITSVKETLFNLFLSYKIERAVKPGYELDNVYALTAITEEPVDPGALSVSIAPEKLGYLLAKKTESLRRADLLEVTPSELSSLIKERLSANYLYNLRFEDARNQSFFNIMLELPTIDGGLVRLLTALEYMPASKELRVVTMF